MDSALIQHLQTQLDGIREAGLWKEERPLLSAQGATIRVASGEVLNFCANNYLGLSADPRLIAAAHRALDEHGFGLSSVRFICGTQNLHKQLEAAMAAFLHKEDCILYGSAFDANGGLFEALLGEEDAIISDALNHASIIDGVRLCKAKRYRYDNADMAALSKALEEAKGARHKLIATDGVFSMDGIIAPLADICELADKHGAIVFVDDSHATGFMGRTGRGTPEHCGVESRVDIINSTLGKALGGASGGFTAAKKTVVDMLRQRSRPYLFSNTLAPSIAGATLACLELLAGSTAMRDRLERNTAFFREQMTAAGFRITPGVHPIVPIMLGDARLAQDMARAMLAEGIYVTGFSYPVVPKGAARIRVQISAAHEQSHLERAVAAFRRVGRQLGVIG